MTAYLHERAGNLEHAAELYAHAPAPLPACRSATTSLERPHGCGNCCVRECGIRPHWHHRIRACQPQIPDDRRTYNLEYTVQHPRAGTVSVRWIYMLMIGEFARHAGHGDILVGQINNPITP